MALVTSHTLNSSNGTHAGGIAVTLSNLDNGNILFTGYMDEGGRFPPYKTLEFLNAYKELLLRDAQEAQRAAEQAQAAVAADQAASAILIAEGVAAVTNAGGFGVLGALAFGPEQLEIDRLRREVTKLKAERDILKKATAYFARESL